MGYVWAVVFHIGVGRGPNKVKGLIQLFSEFLWGKCMRAGKFLKERQVTDKIPEKIFFPIHIQPFANDSNSRNNES